jgi:hypothetical protein
VASTEAVGDDAVVDTAGSAGSAVGGFSDTPEEHAAIEIVAITATAAWQRMRRVGRRVRTDGFDSMFIWTLLDSSRSRIARTRHADVVAVVN